MSGVIVFGCFFVFSFFLLIMYFLALRFAFSGGKNVKDMMAFYEVVIGGHREVHVGGRVWEGCV